MGTFVPLSENNLDSGFIIQCLFTNVNMRIFPNQEGGRFTQVEMEVEGSGMLRTSLLEEEQTLDDVLLSGRTGEKTSLGITTELSIQTLGHVTNR